MLLKRSFRGLEKRLGELEIKGRNKTAQAIEQLRSSRILRRFLETWLDLLLDFCEKSLVEMCEKLAKNEIIFIKSCCKHEFPRHSLPIRPYHPSLPAGPLNWILCLSRTVIGMSLLVDQQWHVYVWGSIGERHFWVCPCFSSSVPHVLFVLLGWF